MIWIPQPIRCLTLYQPWASLVARGWKVWETRGHSNYNVLIDERIAIHAGKTYDSNCIEELERIARSDFGRHQNVQDALDWLKSDPQITFGAIICTAWVAECRWLKLRDVPGALCDTMPPRGQSRGHRYGYRLSDIQLPEKPIKVRGRQGIWTYDPEQETLRQERDQQGMFWL